MDIPDTFTICIPEGHALNKPQPLFSAITEEQVATFRAMFGGAQVEGDGSAAAAAAAAGGAGGAGAAADAGAAKGKKGKGGGAGAGAGAAAAPKVDLSGLPDVARVDLRVGVITKAWPHPDSDKLWCEEIDVGEAKPRQVASGLRAFYSQEQMTGRRVLVVCNLKPRPMAGFESQGMVLCAGNADRSVVEFVDPPAGARVGERLTLDGLIPDDAQAAVPEVVNPAKKGNPWTNVAPQLATDASRVFCFNGQPFKTSAGPCIAPTLAASAVS